MFWLLEKLLSFLAFVSETPQIPDARVALQTENGSDSAIEDDAPVYGYRLEKAPFNLEHLVQYQTGGHHPIHLGDYLGEGKRYHVIHKLGNGGLATVWLCRDTFSSKSTRYVALKVLMSDEHVNKRSEADIIRLNSPLKQPENKGMFSMVSLPLETFSIEGPNGEHVCLVYPILGPKFDTGVSPDAQIDAEGRRAICNDIVRAVNFLHSQGVCHGDITHSNVLHQVRSFDGLEENDVIRLLGRPERNPIRKMPANDDHDEPTVDDDRDEPAVDDDHDEPTIPQYLVYPVEWSDAPQDLIRDFASLIDFGESFKVGEPPEYLGTPVPYRSPELWLENTAGIGSDLWALGCVLFYIRTGRILFNLFDTEMDEYIDRMVRLLGPLPEPWWSTTWAVRKKWYEDEADDQGRVVAINPEEEEKDERSLEEKLAVCRKLPQEEVELFADLLRKLFRYDPELRISAAAALEHEWFKM